jgi:hypothetical protein
MSGVLLHKICFSNPFRSETTTQNGLNYEIQFFYTDTKKSDGSITDDELTTVVYLDGTSPSTKIIDVYTKKK